MKHGARLVIRTLADITENKVRTVPQTQFINQGEPPKLAPKIHPEDCIINWNNDPVKIHNFIRGLAPHPCARSYFKNESSIYSFKIFESQPEIEKHFSEPGKILSDGKSYLKIGCKNGFLSIVSLQLEGKRRMNTVEFLRGFSLTNFTIPVS